MASFFSGHGVARDGRACSVVSLVSANLCQSCCSLQFAVFLLMSREVYHSQPQLTTCLYVLYIESIEIELFFFAGTVCEAGQILQVQQTM